MAEIEIKRTNFFDGQFLKQAEFLDLDAYHVHMRRRWAFVMFNQSGVVQATATDLTVVVPNAAVKQLLVKAGMAIGKRGDLAEAKEVVLPADTALIDLTTVGPNVPAALQAGDTGVVTVNYFEEPVALPPSEGDVAGPTRIRERAQITVHRNATPGPNAANGEPFITLGSVIFNSMAVGTAPRQTAFLNLTLLASLQLTMAAGTVTQGGSIVANVSSSMDLSAVTAASGHITVQGNGVAVASVAHPTSTSLTITLSVSGGATVGAASVTITVGGLSSRGDFTVQAAVAAPTLTSVPATATRNQLMTIQGTNFIAPVSVTFTGGGPAVTNFTSATTTQLVLQVPGNNVATGIITVLAAGGSVNSANPVVIL